MKLIRDASMLAAGLGLSLGLAASAQAAYKCVDEKGRTVYSDIPCAMKPPPPPPAAKAELVKAKSAEPAAPLTKITEADVLRVLGQYEDYTRQNNGQEMCNLYADDLKLKADMQNIKPPKVIAGGKAEICTVSKDSADQARKAGLIQVVERGPTKVVIEPGETRASAAYDMTVKITRYDRIISTYKCSSKDQLSLVSGKVLLSGSDAVCKP
jgi:hypothetical protein